MSCRIDVTKANISKNESKVVLVKKKTATTDAGNKFHTQNFQ